MTKGSGSGRGTTRLIMQSGNPTYCSHHALSSAVKCERTCRPSWLELSIMFSQAMKFSGAVRPARHAGGNSLGNRLGDVRQVLVEHGGEHERRIADFLGNRLAIRRSDSTR